MTVAEGRQTKDIVLPITDARGLRDEIAKLLSDLYEANNKKVEKEETVQVAIKGGSFK